MVVRHERETPLLRLRNHQRTLLQVVYQETLSKMKKALTLPSKRRGEIQIVTGFLGRGQNTGVPCHSHWCIYSRLNLDVLKLIILD